MTLTEEEIKREFQDVKIYFARSFPFVIIPLSYIKVVLSKEVDGGKVDSEGTLVINPDWWSSLEKEQKRIEVLHLVLHIMLMHYMRGKGIDPTAYNLSSCAKVSDGIDKSGFRSGSELMHKIAELLGLDAQDVANLSTEEIARLLEKKLGKQLQKLAKLANDLMQGPVSGGKVIQEGGDAFKQKDETEIKRMLAASRAMAQMQQAGSQPLGIDRLVDEVLNVKPPWQVTVRFGIRSMEKTDTSFRFPNRRADELPGGIGYRYKLYVLIDTSGSIDETTLKYFMGLVKFEAKKAEVHVYPWDADKYDELIAKSPQEVAKKIARKMKGGGGTVIKPIMEFMAKRMRNGDGVIVLTDGDIFDVDNADTRKVFAYVGKRAGFSAIGFTRTPVKVEGWRSFLLHMGGYSVK